MFYCLCVCISNILIILFRWAALCLWHLFQNFRCQELCNCTQVSNCTPYNINHTNTYTYTYTYCICIDFVSFLCNFHLDGHMFLKSHFHVIAVPWHSRVKLSLPFIFAHIAVPKIMSATFVDEPLYEIVIWLGMQSIICICSGWFSVPNLLMNISIYMI